jgi:hypothetical protein
MKTILSSAFAFLAAIACHAKEITMPTLERNGRAHVSVSSLAGHNDIAIKQLPGRDEWVICAGDRCALLKEVARDRDETLVSVEALAHALGATPRFDAKGRRVIFTFEQSGQVATDTVPRPGSLAPNFRLTRLDGTPVSLSDFAGKRVLINSWASW